MRERRRREEGYLQRMLLTYRDGVDGWTDDCLAFTRPWGFDLDQLATPTSVWFGPADVLSPAAHHSQLLSLIPAAVSRELHGGHILSDHDLASIYRWLGDPDC